MLPHGSWPEPVDGAYSRASVQQFLDDAEVARVHLEAALDVAHQRRRLLQDEIAAVVERNARLTRELFDTTREIRTDRHSQANAVAVVLAAAEAEAAAKLATAQSQAAAIRAARPSPAPAPALSLVTRDDGPAPAAQPLLVS